ncbi:MAG: hypothetical protein ACTSQK_09650 [Candidatus Heimdallarchaeota archaeon]
MNVELGENERIVKYDSNMVCPKCDETITEILEIHTKFEYPKVRLSERRAAILTCPKCRVILGATIYP